MFKKNRKTNFKSISSKFSSFYFKTKEKEKFFVNWDLSIFKTKECINQNCKDQKTCPYYHNEWDKRRSPVNYNYDIKLCKNIKNCSKEDDCEFAHNKIEILYHPFFYKKKFCLEYFENEECSYKNYCSFAHNDEELRFNLLHNMNFNYNFFLFFFKTEFCPLGKINHNRNICVYSHNFQDYKRKKINHIIPIKCKNWDLKESYNSYKKGCYLEFDCNYGHGWKELSYNPSIYKTKKCLNDKKNCNFKNSCHYYHNYEEELKYKINKNDLLIIVPKNKLSNNKFKKDNNFDYLKKNLKLIEEKSKLFNKNN